MENCGTVDLVVQKSPDLVGTPLSVSFETMDGEAKAGEDFVYVRVLAPAFVETSKLNIV